MGLGYGLTYGWPKPTVEGSALEKDPQQELNAEAVKILREWADGIEDSRANCASNWTARSSALRAMSTVGVDLVVRVVAGTSAGVAEPDTGAPRELPPETAEDLIVDLIQALPKCSRVPGAVPCPRPATKAYERGGLRFCDEHAPSDCPDYQRAAPLRRACARIEGIGRKVPWNWPSDQTID
jgi:hypothetical protein